MVFKFYLFFDWQAKANFFSLAKATKAAKLSSTVSSGSDGVAVFRQRRGRDFCSTMELEPDNKFPLWEV